MKIRTDFVTNSSSSSFILGFTSENNIGVELAKDFPHEYAEELGKAFRDALEGERLTKEEVIEYLTDILKWEVRYKISREYRLANNCSHEIANEYIESEAGQKAIQKGMKEKLQRLRNKMEGKEVFVRVGYEDYELESEVMPHLDVTMAVIDEH